jgi:tryptophan synthase alpha chain
MVNRYTKVFEQARAKRQGAFIPFTIIGWPDPDRCLQSIVAMIEEGASALELGIAFSDPVADGPTIQKAAFETLDAGFTVTNAFELIARVRKINDAIPIGVLTYLNIVLARGAERFFQDAAAAGVDSILIAYLPPEAGGEVSQQANKHAVALVFIASPLTGAERLKQIASLSSAYIYIVSRLGITGSGEQHDAHLSELLDRARQVTDLPLLVGFGISSPAAAAEMMAKQADGVITGSKIVELLRGDQWPELPKTRSFLRDMRAALTIENSHTGVSPRNI